MHDPLDLFRVTTLASVALVAALANCGKGEPEDAASRPDTVQIQESRRMAAPSADGQDGGPTATAADPAEEPPAPAAPAAEVGAGATPPAGMPSAADRAQAYAACRDSVQSTLADPGGAGWPTVPDTMAPGVAPGEYRIVAQVRSDSLSPGTPFLCVVRRESRGWTVLELHTQQAE